MADYNKTINLPKTDFPMRAKLAQREPGMLEEMNRKDLYRKVMERNKDKTPFILHDGPPYANGDIHIGTAMNKILKDLIIRYKNMTGHYAPYVPGWDTHGMPIETAIQKKGVKRNTMSCQNSGTSAGTLPWISSTVSGNSSAAWGALAIGSIPTSP